MNEMMMWNWDFWCMISGVIAIVGPILLVFWYVKAVKTKIAKLLK